MVTKENYPQITNDRRRSNTWTRKMENRTGWLFKAIRSYIANNA
jgi:hypothetical protein